MTVLRYFAATLVIESCKDPYLGCNRLLLRESCPFGIRLRGHGPVQLNSLSARLKTTYGRVNGAFVIVGLFAASAQLCS
jgi:hypothetical protein